MKKRVILVQLGSPKSPSNKDVRKFLREFLGDPRLIDLPRYFWNVILYGYILIFRPSQSGKAYKRIWDGKSFPLIKTTDSLKEKLKERFGSEILVSTVFLYGQDRGFNHVFDEAGDNIINERWIIFPLYPQYSETTTASVYDSFNKELKNQVIIPQFEIINSFNKSDCFIDPSINIVNTHIVNHKPEHLVFSFHGIPKARILKNGDPYFKQCYETFLALKERVVGVDPENIHITFQSRFGSEEWLTPYTDEYIMELEEKGAKSIAVHCPAFVADCLETIDEIGTELKEELSKTDLTLIPCLNDRDSWVDSLGECIEGHFDGKNCESYEVDTNLIPKVKMSKPPLSEKGQSFIKDNVLCSVFRSSRILHHFSAVPAIS